MPGLTPLLNQRKAWLPMLWLSAVVFLYPISQVIALRNLVLVLGLLTMLLHIRQAPRPQPVPLLKSTAWALTALTLWMIVHSAVIAMTPGNAFDELRGNWLQPLLIGVLGALVAARLSVVNALRAIVFPLLAHLVWVLLYQLVIALQTFCKLSASFAPIVGIGVRLDNWAQPVAIAGCCPCFVRSLTNLSAPRLEHQPAPR